MKNYSRYLFGGALNILYSLILRPSIPNLGTCWAWFRQSWRYWIGRYGYHRTREWALAVWSKNCKTFSYQWSTVLPQIS